MGGKVGGKTPQIVYPLQNQDRQDNQNRQDKRDLTGKKSETGGSSAAGPVCYHSRNEQKIV